MISSTNEHWDWDGWLTVTLDRSVDVERNLGDPTD